MSETQSSRPPFAGRLQSSVEQAIKRPVKDAVHEALAAADQSAGADTESDAPAAESRRIEVDPSDVSAESSSDTGAASRSSVRNRLRSRRTLALALVAVGAYLGRRRASAGDE